MAEASPARLAAWWSTPASARHAYVVAAAIGLVSIVIIYGPSFVFGTSDYWDLPTLPDQRMYMMGYRYFAYEPWHWPIFEAHTSAPFTRSIAFNDTPLLWALIHKSIATVIPPWRDYSAHAFLGLWYGLASSLQAGFGVANLRALGHKSWGATIVTALVFIAIPAWTYRFPHASLFAHFILLWAIYLYLVTPASKQRRTAQVVQLAVASMSNAYLTVMSLAVFAASLARSSSRRSAIVWFGVGCIVVAAMLALAGYFSGEATTSTVGFSKAGANLLGPVLPMSSGWFGDRAWSDPTGMAYEGVCYLGVGVLVLAVVAARSAITRVRRHLALAIVAAGATVLSLSNHIYIGSHRVAAYPIPHALHWIPDQFRCPGRFSWLPMYLVVIFALSQAFTRFATGWKRLVVLGLAIAQVVDVTPDWRRWRELVASPAATPLDVAGWRTLIASSHEIDVFPAHDCNSDRSFELATQIEYLASESATPINGIYTARPSRDCDADIARLVDFEARPHVLYVFLAPTLGVAKRFAATGLPCAEFAAGEVCDVDRALIESVGWPATPPPPPLRFGDPIDIADPAATYLELGWASSEPDGRWTEGRVARLGFRPTGEAPARPQLRIEAQALLCGDRVDEDLEVVIGGETIGTVHFAASANQPVPARTLAIAHPNVLDRPLVEIELRPRDYRSPHELGCRLNPRELAVKVRRVWID